MQAKIVYKNKENCKVTSELDIGYFRAKLLKYIMSEYSLSYNEVYTIFENCNLSNILRNSFNIDELSELITIQLPQTKRTNNYMGRQYGDINAYIGQLIQYKGE